MIRDVIDELYVKEYMRSVLMGISMSTRVKYLCIELKSLLLTVQHSNPVDLITPHMTMVQIKVLSIKIADYHDGVPCNKMESDPPLYNNMSTLLFFLILVVSRLGVK